MNNMSKKVAIAVGCGIGVLAIVAVTVIALKESDTVTSTVKGLLNKARDFKATKENNCKCNCECKDSTE